MMEKKKPTSPKPKLNPKGQNPIEEAIGDRAKTPEDLKPVAKTLPKPGQITYLPGEIPETPSRVLRDAPDQPLTQNEMVDLEELNRQTEERFQNNDEKRFPQEPTRTITTPKSPQIPVSKPNPQPGTETSSQESQPPQKISYWCPTCDIDLRDKNSLIAHTCPTSQEVDKIDEYQDAIKTQPTMAELMGQKMNEAAKPPAEDKDLVTLREYILDNGFTAAGVAMHIRVICAQPMVSTATPDWDFVDRAHIPDMVFALLRQPGYLEGIWPSLKIVMGTSKANSAWTAGIATTLAFFDVIRTLPTLKEWNQR